MGAKASRAIHKNGLISEGHQARALPPFRLDSRVVTI